MPNTRFAVAIHALTLLAQRRGEPITSEYLAGSVNTNPVVIRRTMAALRAAKLVASQSGPGGGWQLLRSPEAITLRDIHRAVGESALFPVHPQPNERCPVGANILAALAPPFEQAQLALERELAKTSLADLVQAVAAHAGQ